MALTYQDMIDEAADRCIGRDGSLENLDSDINQGFRQAISQMFDVPRNQVYQDTIKAAKAKVSDN